MNLILLFLLGAFIASFLYCLAMNYPNQAILSTRRSTCDHCGHLLSFWHLIPIFSFCLLRGRCFYCHQVLSSNYLLSELFSGFLLAYFFTHHPASLENCLLVICLLSMVCFDLAGMWLPDILQGVLLGLGLLHYQSFPYYAPIYLVLLGGCLILLLVINSSAIGGGDLKFIYASLFFLPPDLFPYFLLIASVTGMVYILVTGKDRIPFIPCLVVSLIILYP